MTQLNKFMDLCILPLTKMYHFLQIIILEPMISNFSVELCSITITKKKCSNTSVPKIRNHTINIGAEVAKYSDNTNKLSSMHCRLRLLE